MRLLGGLAPLATLAVLAAAPAARAADAPQCHVPADGRQVRPGAAVVIEGMRCSRGAVATVVERPAHGGLDAYVAEHVFVYEPDPGFTGRDAFRFRVADERGSSPVYTVEIEVGPQVNSAPSCFVTHQAVTVHTGERAAWLVVCSDADEDPYTLEVETRTRAGRSRCSTRARTRPAWSRPGTP
jgi:hypothetical protein